MKRTLAVSLLLSACATPPPSVPPAALVADNPPPTEPKPLQRVQPHYPLEALRGRVQGCVTIAVKVAEDGRPMNYGLLDSVPAGTFDQASVDALAKWRWESGKPGWIPATLNFMIPESDKPMERPCVTGDAARAKIEASNLP